ncbi:type II toxin-antitoxin system HipA family toxin [Phytoactinopolyspora halotolerans]|uniref:Type II toxin-antitoxin system HipA family toxin n=1 Tax=Phytoactinopolyspora halotolerans TaxID=1981512 RepID=A0A6L9S5L1_9ACTN|nr:type II toxin-antitoxin system HipA family toxin [Phytoactinopolyspora halotolerans]NED99923.1 type II toxin-antitoxin system HipA family toxin [Phytoactinopolyspora halotolerans]
MRRVQVRLQWSPDEIFEVGLLASDGRTTVFEYADSFVRRGLPLSPFRLPVETGLQEYRDDRTFGPLPGLFDDSLPDGWGMLLMDRALRQRGVDVRTVMPLDRLTYLGTRTMGALTYHPADDVDDSFGRIDLAMLGEQATEILAGHTDEVMPVLAAAGGSAGGARPKVVVGIRGDEVIAGDQDLPDGFEHWLVKFFAESDDGDAGRVEHAYLAMAAAAGIDVPATRLFAVGENGRAYLGVRRFDRSPGHRRCHMHTLSGLLHATHRAPSVDYDALLTVTARLTRDYRAVLEAFRRMVFNIAVHNRDDHTKNFSFLMDSTGRWSLSPAYDVTFSAGPGGEHTLAVDGEGRDPRRDHVLAVAARAEIKHRDAQAVLDAVNAAIARWDEFATDSRVSARVAERVREAIRQL